MADDRPLESPDEAIKRLTSDLSDLQQTLTVRLARKPVGDIELAFRPAPKDGTLFLDGSPISRTTYAALWTWVQQVGGIVAGGFTVGDGSTTFGLPDLRGRVLRGATSAAAVGEQVGADSRALALTNLPAHNHGQGGGHTHGFSTDNGSYHGPHPSFPITVAAGAGATGVWAGSDSGSSHSHAGGTDNAGALNTTGMNATAVDLRQASTGLNLAIWY